MIRRWHLSNSFEKVGVICTQTNVRHLQNAGILRKSFSQSLGHKIPYCSHGIIFPLYTKKYKYYVYTRLCLERIFRENDPFTVVFCLDTVDRAPDLESLI